MYLKDKQYYIDLYDKHTVEMCREIEKEFRGTKNEIAKIWGECIREIKLHTTKGERYLNKKETISEWEQKDREKDNVFNSATAPKNIRCLTCGNELYEISKDLHDWSSDNKIRVLFMYECPNKCLPRRAFFDDGSEWQAKPRLCPKCRLKLAILHKKEPNKIITTETCNGCGYKDVDVLNLAHKKKKVDKNFIKDRERFCLSDKEGSDYLGSKMRMKFYHDKYKEKDKNKEKYKKVELKFTAQGKYADGRKVPWKNMKVMKALQVDSDGILTGNVSQLPWEATVNNGVSGNPEDQIGLKKYERKGFILLVESDGTPIYSTLWDDWAEYDAEYEAKIRHRNQGESGKFGQNATTSKTMSGV